MDLQAFYLRKKFWINDFFHGGKMWSAYKEIKYINENLVEGEKIRQRKIADIIKFAKENTVFYSNIHGDKLSDFPVINKQTILANKESFVVEDGKIPGQVGPVHVQSTSGSSGTPFSVRQDTNCRIMRIAIIKYGNEKIGFHSFERLMHLRSFKHHWKGAKSENFNKELNIFYVDNSNLTEQRALEICNLIINKRIKCVRGYMTTLDTLTRVAVDNALRFPKNLFFISVGEPLTESLRLRVRDKLQCGIISQYGNEENGILGQTDIYEKGTTMHLHLANCYIEILKFDKDTPVEKGEIGRIVITDLTNYAMPMIRYDTGDVASVGEVKHSVMLSIDNLMGRVSDLIYKTNGAPIDVFNSISADIFLNDKIAQWQFVQTDEKDYLLKLNIKDDSLKSRKEHFEQLVKDVVGDDANVTIEFLDNIPVMESGKRKVVMNTWKK